MATATKSARGGAATKVVSVVAAAALALSMMPATALGDVISFTAPTYAKDGTTGETVTIDGVEVDQVYVTCGIHAAAEPVAYMMGMDNLTYRGNSFSVNSLEEAQSSARLGIFGSELNENPDTLLWNLFYNEYAAESGLEETDYVPVVLGGGSPGSASSGSISDTCMPDILSGISSNSAASAYDATIATLSVNTDDDPDNDYDPYLVAYTYNGYYDMIQDVYALAEAGNAVVSESEGAKVGRYGDFLDIAEDYESMILATQYYILSQIEADPSLEQSFAYVNSVDSEAQTITLTLSQSDSLESGSQTPGRVMAAVQNVAVNVANTYNDATNSENEGTTENQMGSTTTVTLTASELAALEPDVIITAGGSVSGAGGDGEGSTSSTEDTIISMFAAANLDESSYSDIRWMTGLPDAAGVYNSNGVENALNIPAVLGFIYNDVIDQMDLMGWYYKNLYHVTDDGLQDAIDTLCANMTTADGSTEVDADYLETVDAAFAAGWAYYEANAESIYTEYPNLISYEDYQASLAQLTETTTALATQNTDETTYGTDIEDYLAEASDDDSSSSDSSQGGQGGGMGGMADDDAVEYDDYYASVVYSETGDFANGTTLGISNAYNVKYYDSDGDRVFALNEPGVYIAKVIGISEYDGTVYMSLTLNGTDGTAGEDEGMTQDEIDAVIAELEAADAEAEDSDEGTTDEGTGEGESTEGESTEGESTEGESEEGTEGESEEGTGSEGESEEGTEGESEEGAEGESEEGTEGESEEGTEGESEEAFEPYFTDVQDSSLYFYDAVYALADEGIITGVSETLYGVGQDMTRAQFATIVYRIAGEPSTDYDAGYTDVADGKYYTDAINWAAEEEVVTGYTNGKYGINDELSFEDMCLIIARYVNGGDDALQSAVSDSEAASILAAYADGDSVAAYADNGMAYCVSEELVEGYDDGTLAPQESVNRQRGATVVARWLDLVD